MLRRAGSTCLQIQDLAAEYHTYNTIHHFEATRSQKYEREAALDLRLKLHQGGNDGEKGKCTIEGNWISRIDFSRVEVYSLDSHEEHSVVVTRLLVFLTLAGLTAFTALEQVWNSEPITVLESMRNIPWSPNLVIDFSDFRVVKHVSGNQADEALQLFDAGEGEPKKALERSDSDLLVVGLFFQDGDLLAGLDKQATE
ncbi:uncharacterized protein DFL_005567 [Arthrobotrys flagrans]|uniref:Uncharacterized protein n=1 Tax=Arthrobotrys flagrans TaxID=97331 RepID=A0A436ZXV7_ARTFL|nr:hypothetical protein DFL_005567 [Arthrobotrys flagrans]